MRNDPNITAITTWRRALGDGPPAHSAGAEASQRGIHDAALAEELTAIACHQILTAGAPATHLHAPLQPVKVFSLLGA